MTVQELLTDSATTPGAPLLEVRDLTVEFRSEARAVPAVRVLSYAL